MPNNYVLLERIELNASAASVTFANIPQTGYTDLKVVISSRQSVANASAGYYYDVTFNGTSANRSGRYLEGANGTTVFSATYTPWGLSTPSDFTANTFSNNEIYIPNYAGSNYKSLSSDAVNENNASAGRVDLIAGLWSDTAAITSITFTPGGGSFVANSTFSLYGLAALGTTPVIAPKASGGNRIDYDGTYWIHTFTSSGTFTPQTGLSCDYLVVAGGGGGGWNSGGGGGAGGFKTGTSLSTPVSSYSITVGAGGAAASGGGNGTSGNNSIFSSITSTGGGYGGGLVTAGGAGGSGGGGGSGYGGSGGGAGGAASPSGQGNTGGDGFNETGSVPNDTAGGGGGGASAAGVTGTITNGGNGGAGTSNSYSGSAVTYAGGGGAGRGSRGGSVAGTGGAGGGGNGGIGATNGTAGTVNLGAGGGGGANGAGLPGAGGSGIVIIRYLAA